MGPAVRKKIHAMASTKVLFQRSCARILVHAMNLLRGASKTYLTLQPLALTVRIRIRGPRTPQRRVSLNCVGSFVA